jgi:hypothetical protein
MPEPAPDATTKATRGADARRRGAGDTSRGSDSEFIPVSLILEAPIVG